MKDLIKFVQFMLYFTNLGFLRNVKRLLFKRGKRQDVSKEKKLFASINRKKWEKLDRTGSIIEEIVLVEGYLVGSGPNYLLRTGILAKAVEETRKLTPFVLFMDKVSKEKEKRLLYESFDISNFLGLSDFQPSFLLRCRLLIKTIKIYQKLSTPEDLISLEHNGLLFGDLLYDTIIKECNKYTISRIGINEFIYIYKALEYIQSYSRLIDLFPIKHYIATHSQYLWYGLLVRICILRNVPVYESTDIILFSYCKIEKNGKVQFPYYHGYMHDEIKTAINNAPVDDNLIRNAERMLEQRFSGNLEQSDAIVAYKNKKNYSRTEFDKKTGIVNNFPIIFIFCHAFSDAPQGLSDHMLFRDYYYWLQETLRFVKNVTNVNWIVKPHPMVSAYGEEGQVEKLLAEYKSSNIFLCPNDFSTASVGHLASGIVTAQGTVGMEFGCLGIPVLLAGCPFYAGFGFTIEPKSKAEYFECLSKISTINKLNPSQIETAKRVYAEFMKLQETDTSLIDTTILFKVWGVEGKPNTDLAYSLLADRINKVDFKEYSLYKSAIRLLSK